MSIPRMNYRQYRKARKLTHECCNYCDGNRAKYCPDCAVRMRRKKEAERQRQKYWQLSGK